MRLMRLRKNQAIRELTSTVSFDYKKLIQPIFIGENEKEPISLNSLPGVRRDTENSAIHQIESDLKNGVRHFLLFMIPKNKSNETIPKHFYSRTIEKIKKEFPESFLWLDTCLCSLSTHGHCGFFDNKGNIDQKSSITRLSEIALSFADSGADGIAPSDMLDGRVLSHRNILDKNGHSLIPIMSYSTKFKSNFYGPFRDAADSTPQFGDRSSYQIDPSNRTDAINSSVRDAEEGADLLMVKPGLTSIDLIQPIQDATKISVGAYQVSGEYASLHLLSQNGFCDFDKALLETWLTFARAKVQFLITYAARRAKEIL